MSGFPSHSSFGWTAYTPLTGGPAPAGPVEPDRAELADLGRLWRRAVRGVVGAARAGERPTLNSVLAGHLGQSVAELPVVEESWPSYDLVNVQAGVDALLEAPGLTFRLVGLTGFQHHMFGLAELLSGVVGLEPHGPQIGNVARQNVPCGPDGQVRPCVRCGLYLVEEAEGGRFAVLLRGPEPHSPQEGVTVQIVGTDAGRAAAVAADVRRFAVERNVFRGQVLSFGGEMFGPQPSLLTFHHRPEMAADDLILERGTLEAVQRQVVLVARHKERLLASGQHLKRGLLLYGPPGVGKTHTVRYLTATLTGTTVIQLTGQAIHLIGEACSVARALQPAMLVIEDVDLIAEDRGMHPGQHPMLFQLLNEMDGLAEDADVLFVLTTNRADLLEPALAARPGRVDQAVELRLPDRQARRRLFELYRGALQVDTGRVDEVLDRTEGVTASFVKELLRRAAVRAADRGGPGSGALSVSGADLLAALDELLATRNAMTRVLLGGWPSDDRAQPAPSSHADTGDGQAFAGHADVHSGSGRHQKMPADPPDDRPSGGSASTEVR